jgi:hypothetical protein
LLVEVHLHLVVLGLINLLLLHEKLLLLALQGFHLCHFGNGEWNRVLHQMLWLWNEHRLPVGEVLALNLLLLIILMTA